MSSIQESHARLRSFFGTLYQRSVTENEQLFRMHISTHQAIVSGLAEQRNHAIDDISFEAYAKAHDKWYGLLCMLTSEYTQFKARYAMELTA